MNAPGEIMISTDNSDNRRQTKVFRSRKTPEAVVCRLLALVSVEIMISPGAFILFAPGRRP